MIHFNLSHPQHRTLPSTGHLLSNAPSFSLASKQRWQPSTVLLVPISLEQLGNSIPSQPTTSFASTQGNVSMAQGTFHAPSFVNIMSGSVQDTSSSFPQTQPSLSDSNLTTDNPILRPPNPSTGPVPNLCPESAFSLGPSRAPVPPKLVSKILSHVQVC